MHLMKIVSIRCKNPFTWKYFATSHGKGIVDGISGRPKPLVLQNVMRKSTGWLIVQNAEEFATTAKALMEKLRVFFVRQNEVEEFKEKINFFQNIITNVTKRCHKFVLLTKILQHLEFYERKHELDSTHDQNILTEEQPCSYAVSDWVLVTYDGYSQSYPVEITEVHASSLQIKVMERAGGNFKWPKRENEIYHSMEYVYKSLIHPIVFRNGG